MDTNHRALLRSTKNALDNIKFTFPDRVTGTSFSESSFFKASLTERKDTDENSDDLALNNKDSIKLNDFRKSKERKNNS